MRLRGIHRQLREPERRWEPAERVQQRLRRQVPAVRTPGVQQRLPQRVAAARVPQVAAPLALALVAPARRQRLQRVPAALAVRRPLAALGNRSPAAPVGLVAVQNQGW
jgi:hypothetical protein